jgi:hypothetical protein
MTRVDNIIATGKCKSGTFFHWVMGAFSVAISGRGCVRLGHELLDTAHFLGGGFCGIFLYFADTCS